jgi:hypothetical protein
MSRSPAVDRFRGTRVRSSTAHGARGVRTSPRACGGRLRGTVEFDRADGKPVRRDRIPRDLIPLVRRHHAAFARLKAAGTQW